ncbi:hypothetical protein FB645_000111 [Coemansia sp. IMI 203386]|nr:hypothetical protein FB645_000111 [Coemansia sp. IMI 203386]
MSLTKSEPAETAAESPQTGALKKIGPAKSSRPQQRKAGAKAATKTATNAKSTALSKEAKGRRRSMVKESLRNRAQYDSLSLRWQEKLYQTVSETTLEQAARYITPENYDSILEERESASLCGYPLCEKPPRTDLQRFHISLSKRKMFDQEELRSYCSNRCMVGSRLYKHQLSEEPLYMRGREFKIDIVVLSLGSDDEDLAGAMSKATVADNGGDTKLAGWYRESLIAKMNVPKEVSESSPLKIVEHESVPATFDVAQELGEVQFADIEGFAPEADTVRIKKNVGKVNKLVARKERLAAPAVPKEAVKEKNRQVITAKRVSLARDKDKNIAGKNNSSANDDEGVLKIVAEGIDIDPHRVLQPSYVSSSSEHEDSCTDDDSDHNDTYSKDKSDKGLFSSIFGARSSVGMSLTQFGRTWMLMDRVSTENTQQYLRDLKTSMSSGGHCTLDETAYFVSPGDPTMATRHSIILDGVIGELNGIAGRLDLGLLVRQEIGTLVSTLDLQSNMAVFNKREYQALCLLFILALSQSMEELKGQLERKETQLELEKISGEIGTDAVSLRMISQRLCEPY